MKGYVRIFIVLSMLVLMHLFPGAISEKVDYEKKLRDDLFVNKHAMEIHLRPPLSYGKPLDLQIKIYLMQIEDVDQLNETLSARLIIRMEWTDSRLIWNQNEYGGIPDIFVTKDLIWLPDLTIFNGVNQDTEIAQQNTLIKVSSNGAVVWTDPVETLTSCPADLRRYPFDQHRCIIRLGSWTHDATLINPSLKTGTITLETDEESLHTDLSTFQENDLWKVTEMGAEIDHIVYSCCPEAYPSVVLHLSFQRKTPQFMMTLVLPICTSVALLLTIFCVPPSTGEKVGLGCFVLLYLLLLDIYAFWTIPRNGSGIPNIVMFIGSSVVLATISIITSIITICLTRTTHRSGISILLKNLLSGSLAKVLCLDHQNSQNLSDAATTSMVENLCSNQGQLGKQYEWLLLAKAIDRFLLISYCLTFLILFATLIG